MSTNLRCIVIQDADLCTYSIPVSNLGNPVYDATAWRRVQNWAANNDLGPVILFGFEKREV
jgi:hypothetical protein